MAERERTPLFRFVFSAASECGLRRENGDDFLLAAQPGGVLARTRACRGHWQAKAGSGLVAALSDGVGGLPQGRQAAALTLDTLAAQPQGGEAQWAAQASEAVRSAFFDEHTQELRGAATLSYLYFEGGGVQAVNVGDSPIYRLRGEELTRLSEPHTAAHIKRLNNAGPVLAADENLLVRFIGNPWAVRVPQAHTARHAVMPGDVYLVCSDGVSDVLDSASLKALLRGGGDRAQHIVRAAMRAGSTDNLTAVTLLVQPARRLLALPRLCRAARAERSAP